MSETSGLLNLKGNDLQHDSQQLETAPISLR